MSDKATAEEGAGRSSAWEVFAIFLRLGLTSFGGPVAHLGYFREEFVARRKWFSDASYADLVALCQFMPGPASSQVGLGIGLMRGGPLGAAAAWTGFTLPSAIVLALFALGLTQFGDQSGAGWLLGLKLAAVAIVAQAVLGMAKSLCPDAKRATLGAVAAGLLLAAPVGLPIFALQLGVIASGAVLGLILLRGDVNAADGAPLRTPPRWVGVICLLLFAVLLFGLPLLAASTESRAVDYFDSYFRSGALVFGGGHVVLPLLQAEAVDTKWVTADAFLAGYGAAQAVPGPLFTFASFLGAAAAEQPNGLLGAALCLVAIFAPSFLLVPGLLPFWNGLRRHRSARAALAGINAAVVGLLGAALYDPVFTSAVDSGRDLALALGAYILLAYWRTPPWLVVALAAGAGAALQYL
ncbi:MAG: chromate efflux transporter [Neomegalonema sp.]|nr:chromate efflux transporter [Neomegalonema sp.]